MRKVSLCTNGFRKLDLSNNLLEGKLPMELGKLKNLTLLDMRNNKLSGGLTRSLESMCSLQELILANNPIGGDLRILEWEKLQGLVALDLSQTGLTGDFPESISKLKNLRFLGLSNNHLGGHISPELATLPSINALYLNGNNFTGELEFSKWFYGKMERRFGAWDKPGLCYRTESLSTSHKPFGVKPCQEQGIGVDKPTSEAKLGGSRVGQNVHFMASLGCSRHGGGYYGFWGPFLLEVAMLLLIVVKSC
ncbi:piriformospora indica-insensitive protein 2-like [Eucalyptus grandis]|uniref:piriformospora indica-insensitive protein 2-like n=1 Tax=Eucalyptus grandis TaxID=71139 RepID=UPI00192EF93E|nr:piriformospora indica-insensitive protein 2-like [Eucalyptus grandis]